MNMETITATGGLSFTGNEKVDLTIFLLLVIWVTIWKGKAMWVAAKNDSVKWFIALLIFQTLGILDILYIFVFSKIKTSKEENSEQENSVQPSSIPEYSETSEISEQQ